MSYIDLVAILLNQIRVSREGNWLLHFSSIQEMIPWCFTYNRVSYSCKLPWYYHQMQSLPLKHPEIHANLKNGEFSCQIEKTSLVGYQMIKQSKKLSIKIHKQQAAQKDLAPKQMLLQSIISLQMTVPAM